MDIDGVAFCAGAIALFIPIDIDGGGLGAEAAALLIPIDNDGTGLGADIPCEELLSDFEPSEKAGLLDKKFFTCWS